MLRAKGSRHLLVDGLLRDQRSSRQAVRRPGPRLEARRLQAELRTGHRWLWIGLLRSRRQFLAQESLPPAPRRAAALPESEHLRSVPEPTRPVCCSELQRLRGWGPSGSDACRGPRAGCSGRSGTSSSDRRDRSRPGSAQSAGSADGGPDHSPSAADAERSPRRLAHDSSTLVPRQVRVEDGTAGSAGLVCQLLK